MTKKQPIILSIAEMKQEKAVVASDVQSRADSPCYASGVCPDGTSISCETKESGATCFAALAGLPNNEALKSLHCGSQIVYCIEPVEPSGTLD